MDRPIYDREGNLLNEEELDLEKGHLIEDGMEFDIPATEGVEEEGHYEYKVYPNGGKDRWWVVDVPGVPAVEAHKETKPIYRYILNPDPEDFVEPGPSQLDMVEAQALYTALMTDTLLETEMDEDMPVGDAAGDIENVEENVDGAGPSDVNDNEGSNVEDNDAVGATDVDTASNTTEE